MSEKEGILFEKRDNLVKYILSLGNIAVAFSGGVDSSFLLKVSHDVLGDRAIAINVDSKLVSESERNAAEQFCTDYGIPFYRLTIDALSVDEIRKNSVDRCYFCKRAVFKQILKKAAACGITNVADGSNVDDKNDYRPGMRALSELKVISPLRECGLKKNEIRMLAKQMNLPVWNLPSAACLASRVMYGEELTAKKLAHIDKAEAFLKSLGFTQCRVRVHESLARIEIATEQMETAFLEREKIIAELKRLGFTYITLDLQGYRTGSMNEIMES